MTPSNSEDLSEVIEERNGAFVVFRSPQSAEYHADYSEVGRFQTLGEATVFVLAR